MIDNDITELDSVSTNYYLNVVESLCASITCRAVLAGDKHLLLGLPIPGRYADRGQTKCSLTLTRWKTLNPDWSCLLAVAGK